MISTAVASGFEIQGAPSGAWMRLSLVDSRVTVGGAGLEGPVGSKRRVLRSSRFPSLRMKSRLGRFLDAPRSTVGIHSLDLLHPQDFRLGPPAFSGSLFLDFFHQPGHRSTDRRVVVSIAPARQWRKLEFVLGGVVLGGDVFLVDR